MTTVTFDTHKFIKMMTERGMPEPQAEAVVQMQTSILDSQLATQAGLDALRLSLQADLEQHRISTKADLRELELRMTVRLGGMIITAVGVLAAIKFFG